MNRRAFNVATDREWQRAVRNGKQLALLVIDVDHFKKYNDSQGHLQGDSALCVVASEIQSRLKRPADICCRFGGEEFAVLLPETDAAGAECVADDIRDHVATQRIHHPEGLDFRLTVSIGVAASSPSQGEDFAKLFSAADESLYRAKLNGRNQVCVSADGSQAEPDKAVVSATR
jgi:diguanylate cyclase (GGDEF)-like protein